MATGVHSWSTTAASNATADSNVNWAEGQAPSSVNDSARALMASVAMWRNDTNGSIATGGSSTAYTVTSNQTFASLSAMDNAVIAFIPHTTSGAAPTLAVDGLTAKKIRLQTGFDIPDGVLVQGTPYVVTYEAGVGEFLLHNFAGNPWLFPLGCAMPFFGTAAPNSALVMPFGQAISRTTYSTLFAIFGTQYGSGNGSTTFNIPDLRDRTVFGKADMGGSDAGRIDHTVTNSIVSTTLGATGGVDKQTIAASNLPSLSGTGTGSGTATVGGSNFLVYDGNSILYATGGNTDAKPVNSGVSSATVTVSSVSVTVNSGSANTALANLPPGIICNWLMRII